MNKLNINMLNNFYDYMVFDTMTFINMFEPNYDVAETPDGKYKFRDNYLKIFIKSGTYNIQKILGFYNDTTDISSFTIADASSIYIQYEEVYINDGASDKSIYNEDIVTLLGGINFQTEYVLSDFSDFPDLTGQNNKTVKIDENGFTFEDITFIANLDKLATFPTDDDEYIPSTLALKTYIDSFNILDFDDTFQEVTNLNSVTDSGIYKCGTLSNIPNDYESFFGLIVIEQNNKVLQILYSKERKYIRIYINGYWLPWKNKLEIAVSKLRNYEITPYKKFIGDIIVNTWNQHKSGNESNTWVSICWSPELSIFISVAYSGTNRVQYSYDGVNWENVPSANDTNEWRSVCWSPELSLFVAVASSGDDRAMYSSNGINWNLVSSGDDTSSWGNVIWSSDLMIFVSTAFSGTGDRCQYSYDGINWTSTPSAGEPIVFLETVSDYNNAVGYFGASHIFLDNDFSSLAEDTDYYYDEELDGTGINAIDIVDDGNSGSLSNLIRIVHDGINIFAGNGGLNLTPIAKEMATNLFTPTEDEVWIDPNEGKFILPRPVFWSKMQSLASITSPEIGSCSIASDAYSGNPLSYASVKFSNGAYNYGSGISRPADGYNNIYYSRILPSNVSSSEGSASFWTYSDESNTFAHIGSAIMFGGYYTHNMSTSYVKQTAGSCNGWTVGAVTYKETIMDPFSINQRKYIIILFGSTLVASYEINLKTVYNIFVTWDSGKSLSGGKSIRVFIDGVERLSTTSNLPAITPQFTLGIVRYYNAPTDFYSYGRLDNAKVWKDIIEDPSIEYNSGTGREDGLHPIYGVDNNYKPNLLLENSSGVGYYSPNDANEWNRIVYSHKLAVFIAISETGVNRIMYSYTGITWIPLTSGVDSGDWIGISWSPELSMFVVVSTNGSGETMYSYDGINWNTTNTVADSISWSDVCWSSELSMFIAVAFESDQIMYSYNGIDWEIISTGNSKGWRNVIWNKELQMFVSVAETGTNKVMTSRKLSSIIG